MFNKYKQHLPHIFGFLTLFFFLGAKPVDADNRIYDTKISQQEQLIAELQNQVNFYKEEAECYEVLLQQAENKSNERKSAHKRTKAQTKKKEYKACGLFTVHPSTNMKISDIFYNALLNYTGPPGVLITSAMRPHCRKSLHSKGKAIDIRWNNEGKLLAEWLDTAEGKAWIEAFNMDYYLENIKEKKEHPNYFYNRKASGPHIHIYIRK